MLGATGNPPSEIMLPTQALPTTWSEVPVILVHRMQLGQRLMYPYWMGEQFRYPGMWLRSSPDRWLKWLARSHMKEIWVRIFNYWPCSLVKHRKNNAFSSIRQSACLPARLSVCVPKVLPPMLGERVIYYWSCVYVCLSVCLWDSNG